MVTMNSAANNTDLSNLVAVGVKAVRIGKSGRVVKTGMRGARWFPAFELSDGSLLVSKIDFVKRDGMTGVARAVQHLRRGLGGGIRREIGQWEADELARYNRVAV